MVALPSVQPDSSGGLLMAPFIGRMAAEMLLGVTPRLGLAARQRCGGHQTDPSSLYPCPLHCLSLVVLAEL